MTKSLALSAEWYARHGWYVVPLHNPLFDQDGNLTGCSCEAWRRRQTPDYTCRTPGKHPRISDWEVHATRELGIIRAWWQRWPNANVGIAAGKSGLLTLDADKYKDDYEGDALLRDDEETVTNLTGSGGTHLVYRMPEGALYTNARGTLPKGIDIRGWGGQFVVPPSLHPSGRLYQWEEGYGPHEMAVRPLPEALCNILDDAQQAPQNVSFDVELPKPDLDRWLLAIKTIELIQTAPEVGNRSENDQSVITSLVRAGATDDEIRAVFTHYPIGAQGKFADKGRHGLHYLAHSIGHARGWLFEQNKERASAFVSLAVKAR